MIVLVAAITLALLGSLSHTSTHDAQFDAGAAGRHDHQEAEAHRAAADTTRRC